MSKPNRSVLSRAGRPARVMVVDDHPIVRQGYAQLIGGEPDLEVTGTAESQNEALALMKANPPDLALVDITLKNSHGIELIKEIKKRFPQVAVLVISAHAENLFAERALEAGALGFINKQEATQKLLEGIRSVLDGDIYLSEAMTRRLVQRQIRGSVPVVGSAVSALSDRELAVFQLIGQGQGTRQIASQMHLSPKTIERYKENIKHKLEIDNATELVQYATRWVLENV